MVANESVETGVNAAKQLQQSRSWKVFAPPSPFASIVRVVGAKVATKEATQGRLLKNSSLLKIVAQKKMAI